jgi:hypothetical protein
MSDVISKQEHTLQRTESRGFAKWERAKITGTAGAING